VDRSSHYPALNFESSLSVVHTGDGPGEERRSGVIISTELGGDDVPDSGDDEPESGDDKFQEVVYRRLGLDPDSHFDDL
jgi:hypothetical protein